MKTGRDVMRGRPGVLASGIKPKKPKIESDAAVGDAQLIVNAHGRDPAVVVCIGQT